MRGVAPAREQLVRQHGKLPVMFDMTGSRGRVSAAWEDTKLAIQHFDDIDRVAMIGDKEWQHGMTIFCKPFTKAQVRYFDYAQTSEAQKWLDEA